MKIDTLLAPKFEFLGPAVANTTVDDSLSSIVRRPASDLSARSITSRMRLP